MASWLKRCPAWQFALVWGSLAFVWIMVAGGTLQWLLHGHLDLSVLLGSAVGGTLASIVMGTAWRVTRSGPR